jgi:hypothetical protein
LHKFSSSSSSKDWKAKLTKLNEVVQETHEKERGSKIQPFTEIEFLIALGITIAAAGLRGCFGQKRIINFHLVPIVRPGKAS